MEGPMGLEIKSENRRAGGRNLVMTHQSKMLGSEMTFGLYLPPAAETGPVPLLWYLSGLTCTHENAFTKAGFQDHAAEAGLAVIYPDTSPRGENVANDEAYDMGQGAGFYVDATEAPWAAHFQMESYITKELRKLMDKEFAFTNHGIFGHSMGGHGAITLACRHPELYATVSAFAPIANPTESEWGQKQLTGYLGGKAEDHKDHDASHLIESGAWTGDLLVDQGTADQFYDLLRPWALSAAMAKVKMPGVVRLQPGYDHSYDFISSFAKDHIAWHAARLS
ncbi:S-formylglutathione hydrolase [Paracoccaceae bacterium GXU_MW_L88]